ncbi:MAG: NADH-quinone oxidoreductase subunit L [Ilumatobacteraceae bacterium]|nr:NADH-quinone oxidoreductase subunit L [Ilumatobacteraceae bacterium]
MFAASEAAAETAAVALKSGWFLENAWIIPIIPAVAFALIIFFGKKLPLKGSELGVLSMVGSLVFAGGAAYQWIDRVNSASEGQYIEPVIRTWTWWQSGGFDLTIGQHMDGLSLTVLVVVAFISTLVQIYSLEYLRGDRRYTHFFASLTLFSAGMMNMVIADNMIQLILGWEIMGLCSFMLIGHWWEDQANSRAALKAFFTTRTGDIGLLVGTSILFFSANSWTQEHLGVSGFSIRGLSAWALSGSPSSVAITAGAFALFVACIGKSGQFPLHTWLPDAMAGPTPVSSLLHSSTMVVAGVFLVARLFPVFYEGMNIYGSSLNFVTLIGGITIIIAALLAFVQNDIKKVLAYSTVSQLGYMMMGLGAGAWLPAVFHIFTHAFFKACLFLAAGSVSHSGSHHSFDMKKDMGGLRKYMPITFVTWVISTLALCGVFPLSGFFSKDEIIDNVGYAGYDIFMIVGLVGAFMTAAYMTRATYLTFFGEPRGAAAGEHHEEDSHGAHDSHDDHGAHDAHDDHGAHASHGPHESNAFITVPLIILATLAIGAGFLNAVPFGEKWENMKKWVEPRAVVVGDVDHAAVGEVRGVRTADTMPATTDTVVASEDTVAVVEEGVPVEAKAAPLMAAAAPAESASGKEGYGEEGHGSHSSECGKKTPEAGVCYAPYVKHAPFKWSKAALSMAIVFAGIILSWLVSVQLYTRKRGFFVGLTKKNKLLAAGHAFLVNKYYLDHLYEKIIVRGIAHPIAKGAYWINQNVLDGVVNGAGIGTKGIARWVYRNVDQRVVDGAVNGSGAVARGAGGALRPVQSGKVNQYGALLFAAAAVAGLVLIIINT